jgi:hypothetical protein
MQLAIGDEDRTRDPRTRHFGQHTRQFRHQQGSGVIGGVADRGQPHLHAEGRDLGLKFRQRGFDCMGRSEMSWLALASVTTSTMSASGSRSSFCSDGFRRAAKSTAPAARR